MDLFNKETNDPKNLRITHINIQNWRNFRKIDTELQQRVFLVGPNASGKSNFLDIFRFLNDIVSVGGGFQEALRKRGGLPGIRALSARQYPDVIIKFSLGTDEQPNIWSYELRFKQDKFKQPTITKERITHRGKEILDRPKTEDIEDPARLNYTYLEQVNVNKEFREISEFLKFIRYLHIVPQLVREPDRSVGKKNDPYGGDFLDQIISTPKKTQDARLRRIGKALSVAVPQLKEIKMERDEKGKAHLIGRYEHWRKSGAWQKEDQFSDGTLRLLGLLWALLDGDGPLLLEEPELSLHPEVIRHIPEMFAKIQIKSHRQIIVSTHSPDILKDEGIGLTEVLLLKPSPEGTKVVSLNKIKDAEVLLKHGVSLAEFVIPHTMPANSLQLTLFSN